VAQGMAPATLLDSYEAERRPIAEAIARSGDDAEARARPRDVDARRALGAFLATPEGRRAGAIAEMEIAFGYDRSPIVEEIVAHPAAGGTPIGFRVGDAAPIGQRGRARRLHELIATLEHTLFVMLGEADAAALDRGLALAAAAGERYRPHLQAYVVTRNATPGREAGRELLCDRTGALHMRLGADRPTLCLVRPDGHLGLRLAPPSVDRLETHLRRILRPS